LLLCFKVLLTESYPAFSKHTKGLLTAADAVVNDATISPQF